MSRRQCTVFNSEEEIIKELATIFENVSRNAITDRGVFQIGVSGGSLVRQLTNVFSRIQTDWSKWRIFFCDERHVPVDCEDSTYGAYVRMLKDKNVNIGTAEFISATTYLPIEKCAEDYARKLKQYFPDQELPCFDILLLGLGPDGHTCSLFPNHELLQERSLWVAPICDSPKPPPCRITLTYPILNNAQLVIFVVVGEGKANIVKRIIYDNEPLPAGKVEPNGGDKKLVWFMDKQAASALNG